MNDPVKIVGGNGKRKPNDFYPTPPECTIALVNFLRRECLLADKDTVWEPACGNGEMVKALRSCGLCVTASDINSGFDFLDREIEFDGRWIITNPPFSIADKFINRCVELKRPFALLLKSQYWHSKKRLPLFLKAPPRYVLPLTWRPDFTGQKSSLLDMIWVVWCGDHHFTQYIPLQKPKIQNMEDNA